MNLIDTRGLLVQSRVPQAIRILLYDLIPRRRHARAGCERVVINCATCPCTNLPIPFSLLHAERYIPWLVVVYAVTPGDGVWLSENDRVVFAALEERARMCKEFSVSYQYCMNWGLFG